MSQDFEIFETVEHGLALRVADLELADQLEDFFSEDSYVLFSIRFEADFVEFHFGQIGCSAKLRALVERFESGMTKS